MIGYAAHVGLVACPFCREMFEEGEEEACPVCGMALKKLEQLPPSHDALAEDGDVPVRPELDVLPWTYLGRGRAALVALGVVGIVLFFLPWVHLTMPYIDTKSGFDLAHQRIGWLWSAFAAWMVLVPTVASRRTIFHMRGARVAAGFLSAIPGMAVTILLAKPPHGGVIPVRYEWGWPMYAMLAISLLAIGFSIRLGGRVDDIKLARGTSKGEVVH